ncbi:MAG: FAD-binding oxidoreductase [Candidatus Eisenbacteria bacterium]|nr:FAD-binding oxidoreductase [Candidatus Eisenbacteria bacterium]
MSGLLSAIAPGRAQDVTRFALGGAAPAHAVRPASVEEAAEVVRACAADGLALVPWGGGVALEGEAFEGRYDVALDLTGLDRVTVYDPDDFTVSAECGVTLATLRAALLSHGHELPLEGAHGSRATLGGVLAANASGARRLRLGAPRDRILGARFVTGDGVPARTGGRVVKNVAGHAVHRLLAGSRGGLGVLLEASLKLAPLPPARVALAYECDAATLADAPRWAVFPRREPAALTVLGRDAAAGLGDFATPAAFTVVLGWEDEAAWLAKCEAFAVAKLGPPVSRAEGGAVPPIWQAAADLEEAKGPRLTFASAHNTPAAVAFLAGRACAGRLVFHAPSGRLLLWPGPAEAEALVAELAGRGFTLAEARGVALERPAPAVAIAALRASLRRSLDPAGVMALGGRWERGE